MILRVNISSLFNKSLAFWILFFSFTFNIQAQALKKMTPEVYSIWNKIHDVKISDSAEVIIYTLKREIGDAKLCIYLKAQDTTFVFDRVTKSDVEMNGHHVLFSRGLADDSLRTLKRKKTDKEKMPVDSLVVFDTKSYQTSTFERSKNYLLPKKISGYCAFLQQSKPIINDTLTSTKPKKIACKENNLIVKNLETGTDDTITQVKEFVFADEAPVLAYQQCIGDSTSKMNVYYYNLANGKKYLIADSLHLVQQLTFDKSGKQLAFLGLKDKHIGENKPFSLYFYNENQSTASVLMDETNLQKPSNWHVSGDKKLNFSESGKRLFFGFAPTQLVKDTTLLDDEIVQVEIWHYDSPKLYTQLESSIEADKKLAYLASYDLMNKQMNVLENAEFEKAFVSEKGDGRYALRIRNQAYQKSVTWLGAAKQDIFVYDMMTNASMMIAEGQSDGPAFSPAGKYIFWYNKADSLWKYYDIQKQKLGFLGDRNLTHFYDEQNDVPQEAPSHGVAGWLKDDEAILIYDKYDIWKISPDDPLSNIAMTDGRMKKIGHKYIQLDPDKEYIDPNEPMLLHVFNENTKDESYKSLHLRTGKWDDLYSGHFALSRQITKANKSNDVIFTKQNFDIFPDLLLSDSTFVNIKQISNANPQQKEYAWGSSNLYQWTSADGKKRNGMVFYPPNFDPKTQYPLLVNFYERSSDDLHRHRAPEAHRSSINYTYYTNLGYVIFNPDITYKTGQPGEDCYDAVMTGVDNLLKTGYIDSSRMALQGHSWGGYQVAFLLTKTGRFRCAESGAPVVNMVSAYGGIRWESGMSRMFQYEHTQSRLGTTLWESPTAYHQNSPIYQIDKITTPVLIMHNDQDGAVPWYQGIEFYMAMRRLNKPAWLLNYNGEPHWPVKWQNRLDFNIRMEQFFQHYLMNGPLPLWMKEGNTPLENGILKKY